MGNEIITPPQRTRDSNSVKLKKLFKSKLSRNKNRRTPADDNFILNYNKLNGNIINDVSLLDERRLCFVSLIGLFQTWKKVPSIQLYSALFILPLKKEWIYDVQKHYDQIKTTFVGEFTPFHQDTERVNEFIKLLKWKDSQNLVFWMLDNYENVKEGEFEGKLVNDKVCNFWNSFSNQLTNLYDPITRNKYKSLHFDENWWKSQNYDSKFNVKISSILLELYFGAMKFNAIQEILYQSNPESLNPIIAYDENVNYEKTRFKKVTSIISLFGDANEDGGDAECDEKRGQWFISDDYDPYDIDENDEDDE